MILQKPLHCLWPVTDFKPLVKRLAHPKAMTTFVVQMNCGGGRPDRKQLGVVEERSLGWCRPIVLNERESQQSAK